MISEHLIVNLVKPPTQSKVEKISRLQNYIRDLLGTEYHTFLQGSYRNKTAVNDINDVDIVVVKKMTFSGTYSEVPLTGNIILWDQIYSEIEQKISSQNKYKWKIERGNKCIKVNGEFNVDIVPAIQVVRNIENDPICIYSWNDQQEILNYPQLHIHNGQIKNSNTNQNYKKLVRLFKNWKLNHFGLLDNEIISSHKIESIIYNLENNIFTGDFPADFINAVTAIHNSLRVHRPLVSSVCGSEYVCDNWEFSKKLIVIHKLQESQNYAIKAINTSSQLEADEYWKKAFNL